MLALGLMLVVVAAFSIVRISWRVRKVRAALSRQFNQHALRDIVT